MEAPTETTIDPHRIVALRDEPALQERLAQWFHSKFGVPLDAYLESMDACISRATAVPQWYAAMEGARIIGGLGVIENDFHERKDLAPNVCAVYVEKDRRMLGVAREMLAFVAADMRTFGIDTLYLLTSHTDFYERCGWSFHCLAMCDGEDTPSRVYIHKQV